jgi:hypothetical protein
MQQNLPLKNGTEINPTKSGRLIISLGICQGIFVY